VRILYVDEDASIGELLQRRLAPPRFAPDGSAFEIDIETDYASAQSRLTIDSRYDAAIVETSVDRTAANLPLDIVRSLKRTPVLGIVLTAAPSLEDCVEFMLAGASDYVPKDRPIEQIARRLVEGLARADAARGTMDVDAIYVDAHFAELADAYPGQWIAVGRGRFLGAAATCEDLTKAIKKVPADAKFWRMPPSRSDVA
jgi:DNA-binding response OmpR family regulator